MGFLEKLTSQLNQKFSVGENQTTSLQDVASGSNSDYGALGDYANRIDKSAERKYYEEGYLRTDPYSAKSKQFEILMQQPSATVLIKKRMFSAVAENYKPEYMDEDEKLFYKTMKVLFQNKCRQIARLEALSKIQKITESVGSIDDSLMPIIVGLTDDAGLGFNTNGFSLFGGTTDNGEISTFTQTIDKLRKIYYFNKPSETTKWITDDSSLFSTQFGQGTGVIELTNFVSFNTRGTLSIMNPGSGTLTLSDPYNAMVITEYDIEKAINDATNIYYSNKFFQFGKENAETLIDDLQVELNAIRDNRNAGHISLHISPETLIGRRVTAVIDSEGIELPFEYDAGFGGINTLLNAGSGSNVKIAPEYLKGGAAAGENGLATEPIHVGFDSNKKSSYRTINRYESELQIFTRLVAAIYNKIQLDANADGDSLRANINTNYARRKLRFSFLGKNIIQPMDSLHIYVSSKSRYDNKLITGINNMFTGVGILQNLNKTATDLKNSWDMIFNPSGNVDISIEKQVYVGESFPNSLWSVVRSSFINEKEGVSIFGGIVQRATSNYSSQTGSYSVTVNASDNSEYLKMGKVNFKPGVDTFNGSLYDPLTPYKSKFDAVKTNAKADSNELLDENIELLASSFDGSASLTKFKLGPNAGKKATIENSIQERETNKNTQLPTKTFYAPDGLVYRWKEGIGGQVYSGNSFEENSINSVGVPTITDDPFAGQDVMNVISLSITGIPYNFRTYWNAVTESDGFNADNINNESAAHSYYASLRQNLVKNNTLWGNFIPFKQLTVDEASYKKTLAGFFKTEAENRDIEKKLREAERLRKQSYLFGASGPLPESDRAEFLNVANKISTEIDELTSNTRKRLDEALKQSQELYSNDFQSTDISGEPSDILSGADSELSDISRRSLRRKLTNLTRRMSYNVRSNTDKNLFIVDDFYDKDYDLMAFNKALSKGIELYNNDFLSVSEKVSTAADLLKLEVFCDSQGHIRVRAPQYNRIPSSVFYRMIDVKKRTGIQVFPQFIDDLFSDQLSTLSERVEIVEDEIRLYCSILGINDDLKRQEFINNNSSIKGGGQFSFLSDSDGNLVDYTSDNLNDFSITSNYNQPLDLINSQVSNKPQFSNYQRASLILSVLSNENLNQAGYSLNEGFTSEFLANSEIDDLINRLKLKSGNIVNINKFDYLSKSTVTEGVEVASYDQIDIFKISKDIFDKIRERQKLTKLLAGAIKNSNEFKSLDDDGEATRNRLLMPGGNTKDVPEVFEHMIEDETYDDYGLDSGKRFIIRDSQIINLTINEVQPNYTYVQVRGVLNPFGDTLPAGLNAFPNSGNGLVTADALDYDLWRQYGLVKPAPVSVPFLSDPISQCLPYATMLLGQARKNILQASLTISGNEYMQQGEVIFIESRGLLFYIDTVEHSYTEGSRFQTSMTLTYGHTPGEYIPVPLDIIGKLLYNNKDIAENVVQRQTSAFNETNLGVIIKDNNINNSDDLAKYRGEKSTYSSANAAVISKILYNTSKMINDNATKGKTVKASVELRYYMEDNFAASEQMKDFVASIKAALTGVADFNNVETYLSAPNRVTMNSDDIEIVEVNLSDDNNYRSPSQSAFDTCRNILKTTPVPAAFKGVAKNRLKYALYEHIVDCWVKFTPVSKQEANPIGV